MQVRHPRASPQGGHSPRAARRRGHPRRGHLRRGSTPGGHLRRGHLRRGHPRRDDLPGERTNPLICASGRIVVVTTFWHSRHLAQRYVAQVSQADVAQIAPPQLRQETAALRHLSLIYVGLGSFSTKFSGYQPLPLRPTSGHSASAPFYEYTPRQQSDDLTRRSIGENVNHRSLRIDWSDPCPMDSQV
jgi:hypothetical protein